VVLHTFSKIYGLAALRVGWAYAPLEIVEVLNNLRGVFTVSTAAQLCAVAALHDEAHLQKSRTHNNAARASLSAQLAALGFNVLPSATNFVCVQFTDSAAAAAADLLLRQNGLIPRTLNEYDMPDCLRITVGLTRHCDKVVQLLASTR
jgi:histidinol-phosphate aminotransferase